MPPSFDLLFCLAIVPSLAVGWPWSPFSSCGPFAAISLGKSGVDDCFFTECCERSLELPRLRPLLFSPPSVVTTSAPCAGPCSLCEDFAAIKLEKNDFEASRECCFGDVLLGEQGTSGVVLIAGEIGPFSARMCVSMFVDWLGRLGERGGDRGERGESTERALSVPRWGDCEETSFLELFKFKGGMFEGLGILARRVYPAGLDARSR